MPQTAKPQSFKNHTRFDPLFHFFLIPLFLLNLIFSAVLNHNHRHLHPHIAGWWVVLSLALLLLTFKVRLYALKNQDRVIRLEERLRLSALLPAAEHASVHALSTSQLVALRFAPDAELPALARRALAENLTSKQIKASIATWRPDHHRI